MTFVPLSHTGQKNGLWKRMSDMIDPKTSAYRVVVAVAFGMIGFGVNFLDIEFMEGAIFKISILAGLFFPLVVALAWGWRYGLLSALAGGCQAMWWLWRADGWGVLYSVPVFTLWIVWHGWWAERRSEGHPWYVSSFAVEIPFRIVIDLGFLVVFRWLVSLNPPPWDPSISWAHMSPVWLQTVAVNHAVTACVLLMAAYVALTLGTVRRFFGLTPRPAQCDTAVIYVGAALFGFFLWALDALVDYLFFPHEGQTFWGIAVHGASTQEVFMRFVYVATAMLAGIVLARLNRRRVGLQELLDHRNRILAAIRNVNQLIVREKNPLRLLDAACRLLVENQGYYNVWIVRTEEGRPGEPFFQAGFDGDFAPMAELLRTGNLPTCARAALSSDGLQVRDDPPAQCTGCPLASSYADHVGLSLRLEHAGRVFGWMSLSCPGKFARSAEEHDLLEEVAGDIAFALWAIETEMQRETIASKYATVLATTSDAVLASDLDDRITVFNPAAEKLFGCTAEEVLGSPVTRFCPEDRLQEQAEMMRHMREKETVAGYESERLTADGRRIPVEITLSLNTDDQGRIRGINAIIRDITERKQAEQALRQEHTMLARTERIASVGSWEWDIAEDRVRWSDELFTIFQRDPALGAPSFAEHQDIYVSEDMDRLRVAVATCVSTGTPYELELGAIRADGMIRQCVARGLAEYDAAGRIHRLAGSVQDVTERKRAEKSLLESEARFRSIYNNTAIGLARVSLDFRIISANRAYCHMLGYRENDLVGKHLKEITHPDTIEENIRKQSKLASGKIDHYRMEKKFIHKNGQTVHAILDASLIRDASGNAAYVLGSVVDITELKNAEAERDKFHSQFVQAQKMEAVGRLAGGVAHDFNNMLGVILGYADILLEKLDPDQPFHADLMEIRKAGERSADLTRQLLAFARKQTVAPRVLDLNKTVESMLKMLRRLIGEDIDLAWHPGDDLWPVKIDPGQIDQILANLCVNARDAIAGVGKVTIETNNNVFDEDYCMDHAGFVPGEYVILAVSDNGCGMDSETLSHLFEPFFTTKALGQGTGLGLATVYGVVKQNNGFINVYSEPGQGTTFRIYLSRHLDKEAPSPEKRPDKPGARGNETILLVEDESAILKMTTVMLERAGYTVVAAATPGEAIRLAHEHAGDIHLLMSDVVMPEMNGRDLAKSILSFYPRIKCLFMSGYTADVIAHHGVLDEGVNFIQKPFSVSAVTVKVREVLDRDSGN